LEKEVGIKKRERRGDEEMGEEWNEERREAA